jgi:hypothetical protein
MKKYTETSDAVVAFLRDELERRYRYENVQRFKDLQSIDPEIVTAFRGFVLCRIYPEGAARAEIDEAFATLHELLRSPLKMASLGSVALSAIWRLGRRLPAAVSAGQQVINSFSCASVMEAALRDAVLERGIAWESGLNVEEMRPVFAELPPSFSEARIEALVRLLELSTKRETMQTGLELLQNIADTMSAGGEAWTDMDRRGVTLAMATLREAVALFSRIDDRDVAHFIRGIQAVETDWDHALRSEK